MNRQGHDLLRVAVQLAQRLYEATDREFRLVVVDGDDEIIQWPDAFDRMERAE